MIVVRKAPMQQLIKFDRWRFGDHWCPVGEVTKMNNGVGNNVAECANRRFLDRFISRQVEYQTMTEFCKAGQIAKASLHRLRRISGVSMRQLKRIS